MFSEYELISYLDDPNWRVRGNSVRRLGRMGSISAVPALARILTDEHSAQVRVAAADALGRIPSKDAAVALLQGVNDSEPQVRFNVVWGLFEHHVNIAFTYAAWALGDPSKLVRKHAKSWLVNSRALTDKDVKALGKYMVWRRRQPMPSSSEAEPEMRLTADVLTVLADAMRGADESAKIAALRLVRTVGVFGPSKIDALLQLTEDQNEVVRAEAAVTLSVFCTVAPIQDDVTTAALRRLADDSIPSVRAIAARALAQLESAQ